MGDLDQTQTPDLTGKCQGKLIAAPKAIMKRCHGYYGHSGGSLCPKGPTAVKCLERGPWNHNFNNNKK